MLMVHVIIWKFFIAQENNEERRKLLAQAAAGWNAAKTNNEVMKELDKDMDAWEDQDVSKLTANQKIHRASKLVDAIQQCVSIAIHQCVYTYVIH